MINMNKINAGISGFGFWNKNHARGFSKLDCCNLAAMADVEASSSTLGVNALILIPEVEKEEFLL